jgi:hypothetical protein
MAKTMEKKPMVQPCGAVLTLESSRAKIAIERLISSS